MMTKGRKPPAPPRTPHPAPAQGQGSQVPVQPDSHEQSGSAGRPSGRADMDQRKDTGQDRYGQTGLGGTVECETAGQARYRRSGVDGDPGSRNESNPGSGRADHDPENNVQRGEDDQKAG